jgi:hypothetical protein
MLKSLSYAELTFIIGCHLKIEREKRLAGMTITHIIILLVTGAVAGFAGGLLGLGTAFIMAPVQYMLYTNIGIGPDMAIKLAFGTNLLVILPTAISGMWSHYAVVMLTAKLPQAEEKSRTKPSAMGSLGSTYWYRDRHFRDCFGALPNFRRASKMKAKFQFRWPTWSEKGKNTCQEPK